MADAIGLKLIVAQAMGRLLGTAPVAQFFNEAVAGYEVDEYQAAVGATYTSDVVDLGIGGALSVFLTTANMNGTSPSLTTSVLTSKDNGVLDAFRVAYCADSNVATYAAAILGAFPAVTANGTKAQRFIVDRYVKFIHTITGSSTPAKVTGTGATGGFTYGASGTVDTKTLTLSWDAAGPVTVTFAAPANAAAIATQINTATGVATASIVGGFLQLVGIVGGAAGNVNITGGTALTALGLTVGSTPGISLAIDINVAAQMRAAS